MIGYFNCFGAFLIDNQENIVKQELFSEKEILIFAKDKQKIIDKYTKRWKVNFSENMKYSTLFLTQDYLEKYRAACLLIARQEISESLSEDLLIIQSISLIEELNISLNQLSKRLREWFSLTMPELSLRTEDNEEFTKLALKDKKQLEKQFKLKSMGSDFKERDKIQYSFLAKQVKELFQLRTKNEEYLEQIMKLYCPNLLSLMNAPLIAKLLKQAGSLRKLGMMPASKIQILGAEKALFRHLKTGSRSPKHGMIFQHPVIQQAKMKDRGKIARLLADKLTIAARVDFFKGDFIGDKLKKEVEARL